MATRHGPQATKVDTAAVSSPGLAAPGAHWIRGALIRRVELLRLVFGAVWGIDAYLKWQPSFVNDYA